MFTTNQYEKNNNEISIYSCIYCSMDGHKSEYCIIVRGLYCSKCACFGHDYRICPDKYEKILQVLNNDVYIKSYLLSKSIPCNQLRGERLRQRLVEYSKSIGKEKVYWIRNPYKIIKKREE